MLSIEMKRKLLGFLKEDISRGDITSSLLKPQQCKAKIFSNENCVVAGLEETSFLFKSKKINVKQKVCDGKKIKKGKVVLELYGLNKSIISVERTALNVLGRMSGVATLCVKAKHLLGKSKTKPALTRKTMPGFNLFDKKAAEVAGVWPHRINLSDAVLIKDNHLKFFEKPKDVVVKAKKKFEKKLVEIEVSSFKQLKSAVEGNPDVIMLDNFNFKNLKKAISFIRKYSKSKIELSGNINLKNLKKFKHFKADFISMGCLTKEAKLIDFSLEVEK